MKKNRSMLCVWLLSIYTTTLVCKAQNVMPDNSYALYYVTQQLESSKLTSTSKNTAVQLFKNELEMSATRSFVDRFGSQTETFWLRQQKTRGYKIFEDVNNSGRKIFQRAFENGLRDTASDMFPLINNWQDWAEDIFTSTIGNTSEKEMDLISISPGAHEQSWWKKIRHSDALTYGMRIEETYVYASGIWRDHNGKTLLLGSVRCQYDVFNNRPKIMTQTIIPLGKSEISAGISFDPSKLGSDKSRLGYSIRWERIFGDGMLGRNSFVGFSDNADGHWTLLSGYSKKF